MDSSEQNKDFTPTGMKLEGPYENDRNAENRELFKAMIREAFNVTDVIVAHHLTYVAVDRRDGFDYQIVEEIPSADTLIFDHNIAKRIWGEDRYRDVLTRLALEPAPSRDELLKTLYNGRATP